MLRYLFYLLVIFAASGQPCLAEGPAELGGIYGITGPLADFSNQTRNAAQLAIQDAGQGRLILSVEDSQWDPKKAVTAYQELRTHGVNLFHVMGAGMSMALKPLCSRDQTLLFSTAASPLLLKDTTSVLRHSNDAVNDASILAQAIAKLGKSRIVGLYVLNEWGVIYDNALAENIIRLVPTAKYRSESHSPDQAEFRSELTKLLGTHPEVFVVNSFGAASALIIKELKRLGYQGQIVANNGIVLSPEPKKILEEAGISGFLYQDYPQVSPAFVARYQETFKEAPSYLSMAAYTDVELLSRSVAAVGTSPKAIISYIKSMKRFYGKYLTIDIEPNGNITVNTVVRTWGEGV